MTIEYHVFIYFIHSTDILTWTHGNISLYRDHKYWWIRGFVKAMVVLHDQIYHSNQKWILIKGISWVACFKLGVIDITCGFLSPLDIHAIHLYVSCKTPVFSHRTRVACGNSNTLCCWVVAQLVLVCLADHPWPQAKKNKHTLHPGRLTWNIIMEVWFRSFSFLNGWWL